MDGLTGEATAERPVADKARFAIGTRGSPLALAQAREFAGRLAEVHGWSREDLAITVIRTSGDAIQDRALAESGGKGLFTKEIDQAQLDGRVDFAVHSAKDLPTTLPDGLVIAGYLPREDPRDALIARDGIAAIADLPQGARVGSASLRRQAMLKRARPDLVVELLRGNVGTRLEKVRSGAFDATLLALAGLKRLGLAEHATGILGLGEFLPAVGQGAIAVVIRDGDAAAAAALAPILCADTGIALAAERAFLTELDGSCRTPIAGYASVMDGYVKLDGLLLTPDGRACAEGNTIGNAEDAAELGAGLGKQIRALAPPGIYD